MIVSTEVIIRLGVTTLYLYARVKHGVVYDQSVE